MSVEATDSSDPATAAAAADTHEVPGGSLIDASAARPLKSRRRLGERFWEWGLEADPLRQLRRVRALATGRNDERALRDAVEGRRVLVTGASAGIGRECARRLSLAGAEVLVVARRADRLDALADEVAGEGAVRPHVLGCDLSDLGQVDLLAHRVLRDFGGVDVLVNNAARSIRRSLRETSDRLHDFERVMRLNYFAALHLTLPLVEDMRGRRAGHVVNVSTLATQFGPQPRFAAYISSKAALEGVARSAAPETRRDGVIWTTVHLPLVRTEMIAPTSAYRGVPAMSVGAAASMVVDGIIRRPVRVSHPCGVASQLVDMALPQTLERVMASRWMPNT